MTTPQPDINKVLSDLKKSDEVLQGERARQGAPKAAPAVVATPATVKTVVAPDLRRRGAGGTPGVKK